MKYVAAHIKWTLQIADPRDGDCCGLSVVRHRDPIVKTLSQAHSDAVVASTKKLISLLLEHSRHPKAKTQMRSEISLGNK